MALLALIALVAAGLASGVAAAGAASPGARSAGLAPVSMSVGATETTADLSLALTGVPGLNMSSEVPLGVPIVHVDDAVRYQAIKGVGAAMTDSAACLIYTDLSSARRKGLMRALFGQRGIRLSFIRVPIGASDFTCKRRPYSYDDLRPGRRDPRLASFSIAHDESYIIPALRSALALNPRAFLLASLWSAPAWMKANGEMNNRGGAGWLPATAYRPLADYLVRFLRAYARDGVRINAITPQNEPGVHTAYPGGELSAANEESLVHDYLVPALAKARMSTGIYGYDFNWDATSLLFALQLESGPAVGDLAGIATHCYFGPPTSIGLLHAVNPALDEIVSECSPGIATLTTSELEIASMRSWASAVALWNLALDPSGGPVQPPDTGCPKCTGVVTVSETKRDWTPTIDYYQLGQLSRFVAPGAFRIASPSFVTYTYIGKQASNVTPGLDDVAFHNPDGSDVLLAYNTSTLPITFAVGSSHGHYATYTLPAAATVTLTWDARA